jgi:hypothetical protein
MPDITADQVTQLTALQQQYRTATQNGDDTTDLDTQLATIVGADNFQLIQPLLLQQGGRRGNRGGGRAGGGPGGGAGGFGGGAGGGNFGPGGGGGANPGG